MDLPPLIPPIATAPLALAKPRELNWIDLLIALAIVWTLDFGLGVVMAVYHIIRNGLDNFGVNSLLSPASIALTSGVSFLGTTVVVWFFAARKYRLAFADALALRRVPLAITLLSIAVGLTIGIGGIALMNRFSSGDSIMSELLKKPGGSVLLTVISLLAPLFEELYYRGFILPILRKYWPTVWAVLAVSLWFTGVHAFQLAGDWLGLPVILLMGLACAILRVTYNSLVPSILCHFSYNALMVIALWVG